ncbi:MAG: hypothetical protein ACE5F1_09670, partial [Planctomycetota bacterium]
PSWIIVNSFNSVHGNDIRQVFHVRLAGDAPGSWTTCLTVGGLPSFFGGDGKSRGVLIGTFSPFRGTFLSKLEAKALNSTGHDEHLQLDPSGLWAILDRPGGVWLASRTRVGTAFASPVKVSGFGNLLDVHPALGPVGGSMKCFYSDKKNILMQDIDLKGARLSGTPVVVSRPLQANAKPYAPTPIPGADGDIEGLWYSEEVGTNDSDMLWAADLDPGTAPIVQIQRNDWTNDGGIAGGFISFAHNILPRWHVMHSEGAWMLGDVEKLGGKADLTIAGVNHSLPAPLASVVFASLSPAPPVPVPGMNGAFALNLSTLLVLGATTHPDASGMGTLSLPLPTSTAFSGLRLSLQGLVVDAVKGSKTFTNTARLVIR